MKIRWIVMFVALLTPPAVTASRRGELLYEGKIPLRAKLPGGDEELAPLAARCINCHGRDGRGIAEGGLKGSDIRRTVLERAVPRRGGPPSRYTGSTFCVALRMGWDPAGVVLSRGMPRFRMSTSNCEALWNYLGSLSQSPK